MNESVIVSSYILYTIELQFYHAFVKPIQTLFAQINF